MYPVIGIWYWPSIDFYAEQYQKLDIILLICLWFVMSNIYKHEYKHDK